MITTAIHTNVANMMRKITELTIFPDSGGRYLFRESGQVAKNIRLRICRLENNVN